MDLKILNDRMRELKKEFEDIRAKLEEAEKEQQKSSRWKPDLGEAYYFVNGYCQIVRDVWTDSPTDMNRYAMGNYYPTFEDCEFEIERKKVIAEMREFEESPDRKWNHDNIHYFISWEYNRIYIDSNFDLKHADIYFETEEKVKECIEKVGINKIKKYYLRIKED